MTIYNMDDFKNKSDREKDVEVQCERIEIISEERDDGQERQNPGQESLANLDFHQGIFSRLFALFISFCFIVSCALSVAVLLLSYAFTLITFTYNDTYRRQLHYKQWKRIRNMATFALSGFIAFFSLKVAIIFLTAYLATIGDPDSMSPQFKSFFRMS